MANIFQQNKAQMLTYILYIIELKTGVKTVTIEPNCGSECLLIVGEKNHRKKNVFITTRKAMKNTVQGSILIR